MQIALLTWGTRGDVQPYMALAYELRRRGHHPVLAVNQNHVAWVRMAGLTAAPLPLDVQQMMSSVEARTWLTSGKTTAFLDWLSAIEHEQRRAIADALIAATDGADLILSTFLVSHRAAAIAQMRGVPLVRIHTFPLTPTSDYPTPYLTSRVPRIPSGLLRRLSHRLTLAIAQRGQRADLLELRARLGLQRLATSAEADLMARRVPTIHAMSEHVLPRPFDWPEHMTVSGFCRFPDELRVAVGEAGVPPDLARWLDAGSAPVFFGFGSMPVLDADGMLGLVRETCRTLGVRALVGAGWSRFADTSSDDVFIAGAFNHDAVLPRCAATVHHGGAGTTAAGLTASLPTLVCSVFADQPLWGYRVAALGVGATFPYRELRAASLLEGLRTVLAEPVARRARALGEALRSEDGRALTADAVLAAADTMRRRTG